MIHSTRITGSVQVRTLGDGPAARTIRVTQVTTGLTGPSGSSGIAQISSDPENALTVGTDGRLYVSQQTALSTADW
jgi:hypothetical protein